MNNNLDIIENGAIAIDGNKIIALGNTIDLSKQYTASKVIDGKGNLIMPGLINCHTHIPMTLFRGYADDLPLKTWLEEHIWPAEAKYINAESVSIASNLAIAEMIQSGTTCFNDMYFFTNEIAICAKNAGMRAIISEGILDFPTPSFSSATNSLGHSEEMLQQWQSDPLVDIAIAPHSIYTCSKSTLKKCSELAQQYNSLLHIHLSETEQEVQNSIKEHQATPTEYLQAIGLLENQVIAAHGVHMTGKDLKLAEQYDVAIAHAIESNMKLASGIAPIVEMNKLGINIGLATDGVASNNNHDLFATMRICALTHKVFNADSTAISAKKVVQMATIKAAKSLRMDKHIGSIEVNKKADLIMLDLNKTHATPIYDYYSHIVYSAMASDVYNVIIDGKIIMKGRSLANLDTLQSIESVKTLLKL
jgi:5-methylthioadenosine/S-adenosylhomocysteine deaminase